MSLKPISQKLNLIDIDIQNFLPFSNQTLKFSNKKISIYVGNNGSGKTRFFNAIRLGLGLDEISKTSKNVADLNEHKITLSTNFEHNLINSENHFLFFVNGDEIETVDFWKNFMKIFQKISDEMKCEIIYDIEKILKKNCSFINSIGFLDDSIKVLDQKGFSINLAASETYLLNFVTLIIFRNYFVPNSFLIIDSIFSTKYSHAIVELLSSNPFQTVLLFTDSNFNSIPNSTSDDVIENFNETTSFKILFDNSGIDYDIKKIQYDKKKSIIGV